MTFQLLIIPLDLSASLPHCWSIVCRLSALISTRSVCWCGMFLPSGAPIVKKKWPRIPHRNSSSWGSHTWQRCHSSMTQRSGFLAVFFLLSSVSIRWLIRCISLTKEEAVKMTLECFPGILTVYIARIGWGANNRSIIIALCHKQDLCESQPVPHRGNRFKRWLTQSSFCNHFIHNLLFYFEYSKTKTT